ncbi:unnamed protein product [Sphenostylis stenocarpa]|uniref:Uncharacterized protein n=1 Tax=Sphenostylis stenocarpa TaxID=92480 RepID=A0AA86T5J3_9FABA|nr:unnamed protein product [Sphenostylis stenocarpa]
MGDYSNHHFLFSSLSATTHSHSHFTFSVSINPSWFHFAAKAIVLSNNCFGHKQHWVTRSSPTTQKFTHGKNMDLKVKAVTNLNSNAKRANLSAAKKERIRLPTYNDDLGEKKYHISEFLNHPSGIAAVLNTKALESFHSLDANTYRCELPKLQFLNFEAAPVLDLRVTSTDEDCLVELLSCKFEGSDVVKEQNSHFSAFMVNHMIWGGAGATSYLEVDVKLNLTLEIYTQPFTMMPTSVVEGPGNM